MANEPNYLEALLNAFDEAVNGLESTQQIAKDFGEAIARGAQPAHMDEDVRALESAASYVTAARVISNELRRIATTPALGTSLAERLSLSKVFADEHQWAVDAIQKAQTGETDFGFRFLLLQTTILGLALPAAAVARVIDIGWLQGAATWMAISIGAKVVQLRGGRIVNGIMLYRRGQYLQDTSEAIGQSEVHGMPFALQGINYQYEALKNWNQRYLLIVGCLGILSEVVVYGSFLLAITWLIKGFA